MHSIKLDNFTINGNLLMRESSLLRVEKLNRVFSCLFLFILVHDGKIVSLRMEIQLKTLSVIECLDCSLTRRNLDKTNTRVLIISRESRVDNTISVRSPHYFFNSFNSYTLFCAISS